jgi:hypothetical protein
MIIPFQGRPQGSLQLVVEQSVLSPLTSLPWVVWPHLLHSTIYPEGCAPPKTVYT